jgi:FSR family fosmidomycin resistance protein-like MFS transporter
MIGLGSAVFHPEASRVARAASGGRFGFAQSTFQVGGNFGHAAGPLLAAFIVVPRGQASVAWFTSPPFWGWRSCGRSAPGTPARQAPAPGAVCPRNSPR